MFQNSSRSGSQIQQSEEFQQLEDVPQPNTTTNNTKSHAL
jgi:hypothetical protein